MTTYRAWDQNDYPWPPPEGWYQAADELWWPEGYGPGPAPEPTASEPVQPEPAPVPIEPELAPVPVEPEPAPVPVEPIPADPGLGAETSIDPTGNLATDPTTVLPAQPLGMGPPPGAGSVAPPPFELPDPVSTPEPTAPIGGGDAGPPPGFGPPPGSTAVPASSSSKKPLILIVGAVVALVVIGAIAAVALLGGDDDGDGGPVAFDPGATPGSAANPHGFGEVVRLTFDDPDSGDQVDWKIQVLDPPTPKQGDEFGSTVRLEYVGGAQTPNLNDFEFVTVGPDGDRRDQASCPNDLVTNRVVSPGEVVEGEVCWVVPSGQLASTTMIVQVNGVDGAVHLQLQ